MCSHAASQADLELAGILLPLLLLRAGLQPWVATPGSIKGFFPRFCAPRQAISRGSKDGASRRLGEATGSGRVARRSLGRVGEADGLLEGPYLETKVVKILH